jgi:hypothetical protein
MAPEQRGRLRPMEGNERSATEPPTSPSQPCFPGQPCLCQRFLCPPHSFGVGKGLTVTPPYLGAHFSSLGGKGGGQESLHVYILRVSRDRK